MLVYSLWRSRRGDQDDRLDRLLENQERLEHVWRTELADSQRQLRTELSESQRALRMELAAADEQFRAMVSRDAAAGRQESAEALDRFGQGFAQRLQALSLSNEQRMADLRGMVEQRLELLQKDNASKLEQMRQTVDEKLHATLEQRLGESFKLVSDRLEAVHKGLGEMQTLAAGVGDLKRVLTNVKSRGTWGEVQLARLIEDTMTADQYARNVKPIPDSDAIVEFAIKLPGRDGVDGPVWLPIDAKFPKEEYERLHQAQEDADRDAVKNASQALGRAIEAQAKMIATKYVAPPYTTDFAIMFLPSEGLYAEVLRSPGLLDKLQALRINVAGPVNLAAMLNSLQMGFRTLAIEKRSSEVWQLLRAVKTEFGKFGASLNDVRKSLETAATRLGKTETRTRVMLKNLKSVEALPVDEVAKLLPEEAADDAVDDAISDTDVNEDELK
ncbi:MAG: DNA recombination protein RmuC [Burkholderiaceae bacterium]|nr:DNA recombination protein RmuC [Burkholderiaceae bacterium]MCD8515918.1 DNA recombination protein RmuC [Burkholderiaceae bacterium]MCD8538171.1 DNA recombination protein RmuC [Burkholderiaceae bacterium]MCD8565829.1 DNA recombination protein RmuC [Burkholderiaceae bacterium]